MTLEACRADKPPHPVSRGRRSEHEVGGAVAAGIVLVYGASGGLIANTLIKTSAPDNDSYCVHVGWRRQPAAVIVCFNAGTSYVL